MESELEKSLTTISIMDEEQLADIELNERKRKREAKRLIRRQAKKRKLMKEEIVRVPRRSHVGSVLWTYRSIPSFKESVWRNPDIKSVNVPFYLESKDDASDESPNKESNKIINKAFFDMKSILEGYSMTTGALSAVFTCPTPNSPPNEYRRKPRVTLTPPHEHSMTPGLIEGLATDYLGIIMQNIDKPNSTIPREVMARFQGTLDSIVDKYLRLNPKAPANFANAGLWRGRYIMNCKAVPPRVSLKEIVDEITLWEDLQDVTEAEIRELVMVSVWIPGPYEDHEILFKRIKLQNPDLNTELWKLYHTDYIKTDEGHGQWLVLGIDQTSRKMLVLFACKAKCGFEEISFVVPPFAKDPSDSDSCDSDYPSYQDASDDEFYRGALRY